jgi:hypothetical protein
MTVVFRSAPGQLAAVLSDSTSRWRLIGPAMAVIPSVSVRCGWAAGTLAGMVAVSRDA